MSNLKDNNDSLQSILEKIEGLPGSNYIEWLEEGKKAYSDEFWKSYCNTINTSGIGGFAAFAGPGWTKENCKPTEDLKPKYAYQMFGYNCFIEDLDKWCEECGITIDFSNSTTFTYTFYGANTTLKKVGVIDTRAASVVTYVFYGASGLHTIGNLILRDSGDQNLTGIFGGCKALENITISGKIGFNNTDFSPCTLLTHTSLMNIIEALYDYSGTTTKRTATLGSTNLAKLSDEEKAIATQKGWSLV